MSPRDATLISTLESDLQQRIQENAVLKEKNSELLAQIEEILAERQKYTQKVQVSLFLEIHACAA